MKLEAALIESRTLRDSVMDRTYALDRVKALSLLPDGMHVTTAMVAAYFQVGEDVIRQLVKRHRDELVGNGLVLLQGDELRTFESDNTSLSLGDYPQARRRLTVYTRRTVLNIAMLLRDSNVARQVRTYLLDIEQASRVEPVDNSVHREHGGGETLDERIERISEQVGEQTVTRILGKTVVPMLNALIEASGEQRRELVGLKEDVQRIERRLTEHDLRLERLELAVDRSSLAGVMAAIDAMNWRQFEQYVAELCIRDGCTQVSVVGGEDRGVDITAVTPSGRRLVVQCQNFAPFRSVWSGEMQKFIGAAKVRHGGDVALFVATCSFSAEARAIAEEYGVIAVDRAALQRWAAGARLRALR